MIEITVRWIQRFHYSFHAAADLELGLVEMLIDIKGTNGAVFSDVTAPDEFVRGWRAREIVGVMVQPSEDKEVMRPCK